ncbi:Phospholipase D [Rubrivivax sp. A210]|uniref:alkaline phosphatase D family protein n=1 Tax=Rubrivivax sp. A210 TaxID=2772301 RepID=UPI00191B6657|nr:alkaline phosphatase D family protein [Rubrivivax sp. A210]CAD5370979.1 Phospholipase D [Rubrivivax sp. A210]
MGRPSRVKPLPVGANRRDFFRKSGSAALALAATPMAALATGGERRDALFQHGVASGDPLSDRVILWTRVTPRRPEQRVEIEWVVAADPGLKRIVARGRSTTTAARDHTMKVDATGLRPGTTYYYRFKVEGERSPIGRTKTLPVGRTTSLRMAVVSCSNHAAGYFNAYARIAERADLDLVLHLGDYLYEYGAGQYGSVRTPEPATEMVTLTDYRMRHAQYKRDADSQAMHRQHPLVAIWDDHETANDAWVDGAQNHQSDSEGLWPARVAAALQAYYEWMPVREQNRADLRRSNRALAWGDLADLIMLEERLGGRSQQIPGSIATPFGAAFTQNGPYADPTRQLLGAEQEAWLFDRLRHSPAQWKFLGQGVMFAQLKVPGFGLPNAAGGGLFLNSDQWDGYQPARDRVYEVIKGSATQPGVDNVVVLTGDIHSSWAADLSQDPNNPVVAAGGYDPATGQGSRAVEFVGTSISSPGIDTDTNGAIAGALRSANPHFKYINLHRRGYMLVDVTPQRAVAEWWYVDTVASASRIETFAVAFETQAGSMRLQPSAQTPSRPNPPPLAPTKLDDRDD